MTTTLTLKTAPLETAYKESWYTILGVGGDLDEWVTGYTKLMAERNIGVPQEWFVVTAHDLNKWLKPADDKDWFPDGLTGLMFPLTGLDVTRLAPFKLGMGDRWFTDLIQNTTSRTVNV